MVRYVKASRSSMIQELQDLGYNYDFDSKTTQQIYRIWQKTGGRLSPYAVEQGIAQAEYEDSLRPEKPKCENCGIYLDESGTCPICDQGEEDYF